MTDPLANVPPEMAEAIEPWDEPIPLDDAGTLPAFPIDALPPWAGEFVKAQSVSTQTHPDMAAMIVLAVLAACAGGRVVLDVRPDWTETTNLWVAVAMASGENKSTVLKAMTAPLTQFERELNDAAKPEQVSATARRKVADAAAGQAVATASKAKSAERRAAEAEAVEAAHAAEAIAVPTPPRLIVRDLTTEALGRMLAEQGGRLALFAPEGGVFGLMAGRYEQKSKGAAPNLDVWLQAYSGEQVRVDRIGRPTDYVEAATLTIGITVQPHVLEGLARVPGFKERGLTGRILFSLPAARQGFRDLDPPSVPEAVGDRYRAEVLTLARSLRDRPELLRLSCDREALAEMRAFRSTIEPRLKPGGDLRPLSEWAAKLHGATARIATLLHVGDHVRDNCITAPIGADTMRRAITVAEYCLAHAMAAHDLMGADGSLDDAKWVLAWWKDRDSVLSERDIYRAGRSRFKTAADVTVALCTLDERGWARRLPPPEHPGPGRKPSPLWELNPCAMRKDAMDTIDRTTPQDVSGVDSVDSVDSVPKDRGNGNRPAKVAARPSEHTPPLPATAEKVAPVGARSSVDAPLAEPPPVDSSWTDSHNGFEYSDDGGGEPPSDATPAASGKGAHAPPVASQDLYLCPGCDTPVIPDGSLTTGWTILCKGCGSGRQIAPPRRLPTGDCPECGARTIQEPDLWNQGVKTYCDTCDQARAG